MQNVQNILELDNSPKTTEIGKLVLEKGLNWKYDFLKLGLRRGRVRKQKHPVPAEADRGEILYFAFCQILEKIEGFQQHRFILREI